MSSVQQSDQQLDTSVQDRIDSLRRQLASISTEEQKDEQTISTGCVDLDRLLPGGALRTGMLVELLSEQSGSGAGSIAIECARRVLLETQGCLVVTDRWRRFYPPAAVARGIETKDLIVVRSTDQQVMSGAEELWALDQALRCPGVGVVMAWLDKVDPLAFRRLQLAAESGQTLAILMRPASVQALPSWSDVQLSVRPTTVSLARDGAVREQHLRNENRFCEVTLLRHRGRAGSSTLEGTRVHLEISESGTLKSTEGRTKVGNETRTLHMAPRMARPANRRRQTGA